MEAKRDNQYKMNYDCATGKADTSPVKSRTHTGSTLYLFIKHILSLPSVTFVKFCIL